MEDKVKNYLESGSLHFFRKVFAAEKRRVIGKSEKRASEDNKADNNNTSMGRMNYKRYHSSGEAYRGTNFGMYIIYCVQHLPQTNVNKSLIRWLLMNPDCLRSDDLQTADLLHRNVLHYCIIADKMQFFDILMSPMSSEDSITARDKFGLSTLHYAIMLDNIKAVETIVINLKQLSISLDSDLFYLKPSGISPLMLASNLNHPHSNMSEIISLLKSGRSNGGSRRDSWKHLDAGGWERAGQRGVYLNCVLFTPQCDQHDSFQVLTGKVRKRPASARDVKVLDPLLITLYEKGRLQYHDKLHQLQLKRLDRAIKEDKQPETYHEILTDLQFRVISRDIKPEQSAQKQMIQNGDCIPSSKERQMCSARLTHTNQCFLPPVGSGFTRSHTVTDLMSVRSQQLTSSFRRKARIPSPPPTPSPEPYVSVTNKPRIMQRKMNAIAAMGMGGKLNWSGRMPTLGKKLNVSIGGTEDINTPISRSRSPMGGTKSPKLPKSKNGELSLNSMFGELLQLQKREQQQQDMRSEEGFSSQTSLNSSFNIGFTQY